MCFERLRLHPRIGGGSRKELPVFRFGRRSQHRPGAAEQDRIGITTGCLSSVAEPAHPAPKLFDRSRIHVVFVAVGAGEAGRLHRAHSADDETKVAGRARRDVHRLERIEGTVVARGTRRQPGSDVGKCILEHFEAGLPVGIRDAEDLVLSVEPAGAHTERESSPRHLIDADRHLEEHRGVAEGDGADVHAETDVLRLPGKTGEVWVGVVGG